MKTIYPRALLWLLLMIVSSTNYLMAQEVDYKEYKSLVVKNASHLNISVDDANESIITNAYTDASSQITYIYLQQSYKEIKVFNTIVTAAFRNGSFLYASGGFVKDIATKAGNPVPSKTYLDAIKSAADHLKLISDAPLTLVADLFSTQKKYTVAAPSIARKNIEVELYWTATADKSQVSLTWNVNIDVLKSPDWWNVRMDARTGEFVEKDNWTVDENHGNATASQPLSETKISIQPFNTPTANALRKKQNLAPSTPPLFLNAPPTVATASYRVVPFPLESPNFGAVATVTNPWLLAGATNNATTNGWHFDGTNNYNITRGNNVFAFLDVANTNTSNATNNWPDTSTTANPSLTFVNNPVFTQQPINSANNINKKFALDNLFYWNNLMHDVMYQYGLNEVSGAFQTDNLGRGGLGNDFVNANAMDGLGLNNANFSTPVDGQSGRMQMYLWTSAPNCTINTPETLAGPVLASEGSLTTTVSNKLINVGPKTGNIVLYNDDVAGTIHRGCAVATNAAAIAGNIAMIDAFGGTAPCNTYAYKIKSCQNAGAIAVIVYSNTANPLAMGGSDATALSITIPVISIPNTTGLAIINAIGVGSTVNFTMSTGIYLDGDIDNGIICHEYGHGVSNRLTGGPANSSCLGNAEQGGEGWSDYLALMMTTNWATATTGDGPLARPMGTYVFDQPANGAGIRRYPYSTNMTIDPLTYANMATSTEVHNTGEIWCSALWDMTWNIIQQQNSITANLYNSAGTGGNAIALNLVMTGMKLQPCGPGFLDARNAILAADSILYNNAHRCAIWAAFARRGMGASALQGLASSATDQTVAFDIPAGLKGVRPQPIIVSQNTQVTYTHTAVCECQALTGYVLKDTIPSGFSYVSSSPSGTLVGNVLTFPGTNFAASETKNFSITLQSPTTGCIIDSVLNDNREASTIGGFVSSGTPGWSASNVKSNSPTSSWLGAESTVTSSSTLTSVSTTTTALKNLSIVSFYHYFNTENTYDGGVVEYSTDGTLWNDAGPLFFKNAYTTTMDASTSLAGRKAFSGTNIGFKPSLLNLSSLGTNPVAFRFRMTSDAGTTGEGWYVDDIVRANGCGGILKTGIYNSAIARQDTLMLPVFVTPGSLPLTLLWFYASQLGDQVALNWKTVSEVNVRDFTIEWSADGNNWTSIGKSTAQNSSVNDYNFLHANPVKGNNFYRIKMNDKDGRFTYSPVRIINMQEKGKPMLVLVPNPVSTDAILYISKEANVQLVKIYNAAGALVRKIALAAGVQQLQISTANLAAGVYTIESQGSGKFVTRMIVQH